MTPLTSGISIISFFSIPCFNVIALDNGQFAAQPNNRVQWRDMSLIPEERKTPDFEVCSQNYMVENTEKWSVGHTTEWAYKSKNEVE